MPKPVKKRSKTLNDGTLPAPVRKAVRKAKRPSPDPMTRAKQLQAEHQAKAATSNPPWASKGTIKHERSEATPPVRLIALDPTADFNTLMSQYMAQLGSKGGKVSGAKRMEMPEAKRKAIAKKAAAARWAKKRPVQS